GMSSRNQSTYYRKATGGRVSEYRSLVRIAIRPQARRDLARFRAVRERLGVLKIAGNLFALIRGAFIFDIRPAIIFLVLLRETNRRTQQQRQQ
ncbi:MAG TPA: hypothetical protein VFS89_05655, partial [Nitrosospira sp.]|nr:hypothetical protein [Nitrosospira sp.]